MELLVTLLRPLLIVVDAAGFVVAGIWLMLVGQWWAIGYGFAALIVPYVLLIAAVPGAYLTTRALGFMDKGKPLFAFILLLLGRLCEWAVFAAWFVGAFYVFLSRTTGETFPPLLIWAYSVALGPWLFMAERLRKRETGGDATRIFILSTHIGFLVVAVMGIAAGRAPIELIEIFAGVTLVGTLIGTAVSTYWLKKVAE
jgi:hypothetical protein